MGNYLIFDGVNTSDYGIVISGEGTYNAPKREVDMFSIPGRNGNFALDKGRFENIEVTYPAANHEPNDLSTFRSNMDDLRNALASRIGYKRLEDTFHPDEYRMAMFKDGLEANMVGQAMASQFDIVFDCKPQRFLKSGGTEQTIANGGTITNPTLFESSPLLEVEGYGDININNDLISIDNAPIGEVVLFAGTGWQALTTATFSDSSLETGDSITMNGGSSSEQKFTIENAYVVESVSDATIGGTNPEIIRSVNVSTTEGAVINVTWDLNPITFAKGTVANLSASVSFTWNYHSVNAPGTQLTQAETLTLNVLFRNPSSGYSRVQILESGAVHYLSSATGRIKFETIKGYSTKQVIDGSMFIDLDIGEAYTILNNEPVSANNIVILPSNLPTLKPGDNTITYDNTITSLKIVPRWWKI